MANSDMYTLTLYYQRLREKRDGEYPYKGRIELKNDAELKTESFICWSYKKVIIRVHELMVQNQISRVLFQRTEREDISPVELGERLMQLLKDDPLSAYRAMLYEPSPMNRSSTGCPSVPFDERVYLQMVNGTIEDPETGKMLSLAYGPSHGWRIRREDNHSAQWIPIELVDSSPDGTPFAERVAFAQWATVAIHDLLAQNFEKYYIPRGWNTKGPWISHNDLKNRLEQHLAGKKKICP